MTGWKSSVAKRPRAHLWLASITFGGLLVTNEIYRNLAVFLSRVTHAKGMGMLADRPEIVLDLVGELSWMLIIVVALSMLVGWAWGAVSLSAFNAIRDRLLRTRIARIVYWSVAGFVFFNVWYSVHHAFLPGSRLKESPVFWMSGALREPMPVTWLRYLVPVIASVVLVAIVIIALRHGRQLRRVLGVTTMAVFGAVQLYSYATDLDEVRAFTHSENVILFGLDSFQMNRLAAGGNLRQLTPNIDEFLAEGYRFDNGWTPFARTYPSWVSILTGRFPPRHGVRFNLMPDESLAADNVYLGQVLQQAGYTTFHGTDETRFSNIRAQHGFDELLHPRFGATDYVIGTFFDFSTSNLLRQTVLGHDLFPAIANNRASASYNSDIWVRNLLHRLDELPRDDPAFIVLHLCGNHWPFSNHAPFSFASDDSVEQCIAMVDSQVGKILDYFDRSGLREMSTIFLLSDHGDGWNGDPEDPVNSHGDDFYRLDSNRALLAVQGPGIQPGVSREAIRTVDIYPTVLDLLGLDRDSDAIDGISLLPALRGGRISARPVFAETGMARRVYTVRKLVEENANFYAFDAETGLMQIRPDACREFMSEKSYMLISDDLRLVIKPSVKQFLLFAFDPTTGMNAPGPAVADDTRRSEMLEMLAEVYRLDAPALIRTAWDRGFLGRDLAMH